MDREVKAQDAKACSKNFRAAYVRDFYGLSLQRFRRRSDALLLGESTMCRKAGILRKLPAAICRLGLNVLQRGIRMLNA